MATIAYKNEIIKRKFFGYVRNSKGFSEKTIVGFDFVKNIDYNKSKITKQIYGQTEQAIKQGKISEGKLPEIYGSKGTGGIGRIERERLGAGISGRVERTSIRRLGRIEPALKGGELKASKKAGFLLKRQFLISVKEARPDIPIKVSRQYIPRSTDRLAIKAKNLILDNIDAREENA